MAEEILWPESFRQDVLKASRYAQVSGKQGIMAHRKSRVDFPAVQPRERANRDSPLARMVESVALQT